ncbi:MAG TPA: Rieske 2Fe-2S domain-containing protein [candidate division Zixibacteria bacterium]|nr:Rieske 2Fe-2S domain-containing protein [candidate division Zixibacteria bacterium]
MIERTARPLAGLANALANLVRGIYKALGTPGRYLQDFANGVWLGHPLHAVIVDVVVGAATGALLLDVLRVLFAVDGLEDAATWLVGLTFLAALGAVLTGLTDFKDTAPDSDDRSVTALHGLTNIVGSLVIGVSLLQRLGGGHDGAFWVFLIGYLVVTVGAFIGGHVVFKYGYMINRNAFARGKKAKEWTAVLPVVELPEGTPTRASLGATTLVVVRRGDVAYALKDTCSHAGGPLSEGTLDGDSIVCPWHQSAFHLADGRVRHGPAQTRQVAYRARINGDQVEVSGPME